MAIIETKRIIRPILVGMSDPQGETRPLSPAVPGRAGARLVSFMQAVDPSVTSEQYDEAFIRVNLCDVAWGLGSAADTASALKHFVWGLPGKVEVVVLGSDTWQAFKFAADHPWVYPHRFGATWRCLPHPSGRNRWYNEEPNRLVAGMLLLDLMRGRQYA